VANCALLFKPAESFATFAFLSLFNNELACFAAADVSFAAAVAVAAGLAASALTVSFLVAAALFLAANKPLMLFSKP
jgi:hypothetical protein